MASVAARFSRKALASTFTSNHLLCRTLATESTAKITESPDRVKWDYRGQRQIIPLGQWLPKIAVDAYIIWLSSIENSGSTLLPDHINDAVVCKIYPTSLSLNVLTCFFASLQSSFLSLFMARDPTLWKLELNVQLFTIIYGGVMISGLGYYIQLLCISNNGPVFVAMFIPLQLFVAAIFSACFFAERIRLGRWANIVFNSHSIYK